ELVVEGVEVDLRVHDDPIGFPVRTGDESVQAHRNRVANSPGRVRRILVLGLSRFPRHFTASDGLSPTTAGSGFGARPPTQSRRRRWLFLPDVFPAPRRGRRTPSPGAGAADRHCTRSNREGPVICNGWILIMAWLASSGSPRAGFTGSCLHRVRRRI